MVTRRGSSVPPVRTSVEPAAGVWVIAPMGRPGPPPRPGRGGPPMPDYKYDFVNVKVRDGIAWTALNRPEKRNAMSPALHYEMDDALGRLEVDDNVRVVVVTGEGGNFSAGQDLKKFFRELEKNPGERKKPAPPPHPWRCERLYAYTNPTIAMV